MKTYIALLRGINVSGQKKIKMAELRTMMAKLPYEDVETYIQSGNIVFKTNESNIRQMQQSITKEIAKTFKFEVPVLVKTIQDFEQIMNENPYTNTADIEAKRIYFSLLEKAPAQADIPNLNQDNYPNELFLITPGCVYLNCINGAGKAKLNNNIIENKLKVTATTRNYRTIMKLYDMAKK